MNGVSWGYRAVFSQEVGDKLRSLTGSWLVVIYINASNRKWLAKVDERTLITPQNLYKQAIIYATLRYLTKFYARSPSCSQYHGH